MPTPTVKLPRRAGRAVAGAGLVVSLLGLLAATPAGAAPAGRGTTDGLDAPTGEAVSGGHLWVTDRGSDSLTELAAGGELVRTVSGAAYGFDAPGAIVATGGHLWVADLAGVTELDAATGALIRTESGTALRVRRPVALTVAGGDVVVVGARGAVAEVDSSDGRLVHSASPAAAGLEGPSALTTAGRDVWVADRRADAVVELAGSDLARVRTVSASADELSQPAGISFDGTHVWVADAGDNAATELTTGGLLVQVADSGSYGFTAPGPTVSWGGYTFIASPPGASPMITQIADSSGAADWYMCNTNGPYHFADPSGLAVLDGNLWVANATGNSLTEMNATTGALVQTLG